MLFEETRIAPRPKLQIQKQRSALLLRDAQMQSCRLGGSSVFTTCLQLKSNAPWLLKGGVTLTIECSGNF